MDGPADINTNRIIIPEQVREESYGEFILLGYNGPPDSANKSRSNGRQHRSKLSFRVRDQPNGIKKSGVSETKQNPLHNDAVKDSSKHVVSYLYYKGHAVLVEYEIDQQKDMFQIGRSSEPQIDFTIVDTWIGASNPGGVLNPIGQHRNQKAKAITAKGDKQVSSTISRYACRILADRDEPNKCYVYAAGFDTSRNIFLGEKATKWQKKNGEFDGLTTNGVLILHPNRNIDTENQKEMYTWREVSVDGEIYTLRETRSSTKRGDLVMEESNQLQDGTLIDLCGATLLWRSAEGLKQSPSTAELERRLDELNAGKPQCPVNLNTLIIPRKRTTKSSTNSKQPYVYLRCGHVQGKHNWGVTQNGASECAFKCPICLLESDAILQLTMGMESAFHLDSDSLDYAFNPCGHVASKATVNYWSRIPLPHGTNSFYPVCPFCTTLLDLKKPSVRLIFQDHCYDT
ncbi:unnamed protein product [Bursaphelenchus okinawaensis]|uniref:Pellino n=1 Tax=Bursaphelenchus okinawaensis TaxID=465554 RepID=A0A811LE87_9BILA|nr:unnamed protein product [Bursaphelenchus okinawaensis]CAG9121420.1 unnamed protein product [Bursaphelenchus okinawaensis]